MNFLEERRNAHERHEKMIRDRRRMQGFIENENENEYGHEEIDEDEEMPEEGDGQ